MGRPTIRDLADAAGVSVSTVNRVLSSAGNVRHGTMQRVCDAAADIGFYGLGSIRSRVSEKRSKFRFGFVLHQPTRMFYRNVANALETAAADIEDHDVDVRIVFVEELTPQNISSKMLELGETCDAVGVVAAVHPIVTRTLEDLQRRGIPVFALISQLSATGSVSYVGLDSWKVGRTSAWAFANICRTPGKIGILVGNHRYRCQDMCESGFRSFFREYAPEFTLLEPYSTFESSAIAQEMTEKLIGETPDLAGLYIAGGGITGAIAALRNDAMAGKIVAVGHELMDVTREALLDGILTMILSHPLASLAEEAIARMIAAARTPDEMTVRTAVLPFEIFTRENI